MAGITVPRTENMFTPVIPRAHSLTGGVASSCAFRHAHRARIVHAHGTVPSAGVMSLMRSAPSNSSS